MAEQKLTGNKLLIPESGDDAATFIPALTSNFEKLNEPDAANSVAVTAGGWTDNGDDTFTKSVTLPTGFTMDASLIQVKDATGDIVYPTIEKTASTTFDLTVASEEAYTVLVSK